MPFRLSGGGSDLAGAQLLANIMSLPTTLGNQRIETSQMRGLLRQMGTPQEYIDLYAPGEDRPEPVGGTGIAGKVLSGVGKTGAVLSTILGAPIKAPRVDFGEASAAAQQGQREVLAGMTEDPKRKAYYRLGQYNLAEGGADTPKNLIAALYKQGEALGYTGAELNDWVLRKYPELQGTITGARKDVTTDIETDRKRWEDENKQRRLRNLPDLPPPPGGFGAGDVSAPGDGGDIGGAPRLGPRSIQPASFIKGLQDRGFTPEQSAAIAGNAHVESSLDPGIKSSVPGENSHGFLQWNQDRLRGLQNYANQNKLDWRSPETQLDWIAMERDGRSVKYGGSDERKAYADALDKGGTPGEMATRFGALVERPLNIGATAKLRAGLADRYHGAGAAPEKLQPTMIAANEPEQGVVAFPSPAPGAAPSATPPAGGPDVRGMVPLEPGQVPTPQPRPVPPAAPPAAPPGAAPPAAPGAGPPSPPPSPGPGVPGQVANLPIGQVKTNIGGVDYTYDQLKRSPAWNEAAVRLGLNADTQNTEEAERIATVMREENRLGQKMDLFDLAAYGTGVPVRGPYMPEQAGKIRDWMRAYENEPSLRGQMARMRMVRLTLDRLRAPVQEQDVNTLRPKVDENGNPVYMTTKDGRYVTPIEELTQNRWYAKLPFAQAIGLDWKRMGPEGEAVNQLMMAQGEMANFVKAAGDSGNASEKEQANQLKAYIPNENDTLESALYKVNQGLQRVDDYEASMQRQFRQSGGRDTDNIGGPGQPAPGGKPSAVAPQAPKAPGAPSPRVMTLDEYLK